MTTTGQSSWLEASAGVVQHLFWPAVESWLVVHASKVQASVSTSIFVPKLQQLYSSMWRSQKASIGVRSHSGQVVVEHVLSILAEHAALVLSSTYIYSVLTCHQ